jgi:hypothetical protein
LSGKHGPAKSFRIGGQLYVQFPARLKIEHRFMTNGPPDGGPFVMLT